MIGLLLLQRRAGDLYVRALDENAKRGIPLATDKRALALLTGGDHLLKKSGRRAEKSVARVDRLAKRYSLPAL